ncbi:MAG: hypothetical protein E4H01_00415, partial [Lysobacterales bacterium]
MASLATYQARLLDYQSRLTAPVNTTGAKAEGGVDSIASYIPPSPYAPTSSLTPPSVYTVIANQLALVTKAAQDALKPPIAAVDYGGKAEYLAAQQQQKVDSLSALNAIRLGRNETRDWQEQAQLLLDRAQPGDAAASQELDRLLAEMRAQQLATAGVGFNKALFEKAQKRWQDHANFTVSAWDEQLRLLNDFFFMDKSGNIIKARSVEKSEAGAKFLESKEFLAAAHEYQRLFGSGLNQGAVYKTGAVFNEIAEGQRKFLYDTEQAVVARRVSAAEASGDDKAARGIQAEWDAQRFLWEASIEDIDPATTSMKTVRSDDGGFQQVRRTPTEEWAFRQQQYIEEMTRQYSAYKSSLVNARDKGELDPSPAQMTVVSAARALGIKDAFSPLAVQPIVQYAMQEWDRKHGPTFFGGKGPRPTYSSDRQSALARVQYEKSLYDALATPMPGILEQAFKIPLVKPIFTLILSPFGLIGSGAKVIASAMAGTPSELIMTAGHLDLTRFPPQQRKQMADEINKLYIDPTFRANVLAGLDSRGRFVSEAQFRAYAQETVTMQIATEWVKTPAGQRWLNDNPDQHIAAYGINSGRTPAERQRLYDELKRFYDQTHQSGPYAWRADKIWDGIEALSDFGMEPFSPDSQIANFLAGVLLDPLNVAPLNVLKYGTRARFLGEELRGAGVLQKITAPGRFATIPSTQLARFEFSAAIKARKLVLGDWDAVAQEAMARMGGLVTPSGIEREVAKAAERLGLTKASQDTKSLLSLAEEAVLRHYSANGVEVALSATESAVRFSERQAAELAEREAKSAALRELEVTQAKREAAAARASEAGLARTRVARAAETEKLQAVVAAERKVAVPVEPVVPGSLGEKLQAGLPGRTQPYFVKDVAKAAQANKFIGAGSAGSSTADYARVLGSDTRFVAGDTVFISANGARKGRVPVTKDGVLTPGYRAIDDAIAARSTIITDIPANRNAYNIGEREVADYLTKRGYIEVSPGKWQSAAAGPPLVRGRGAAARSPAAVEAQVAVKSARERLAALMLEYEATLKEWALDPKVDRYNATQALHARFTAANRAVEIADGRLHMATLLDDAQAAKVAESAGPSALRSDHTPEHLVDNPALPTGSFLDDEVRVLEDALLDGIRRDDAIAAFVAKHGAELAKSTALKAELALMRAGVEAGFKTASETLNRFVTLTLRYGNMTLSDAKALERVVASLLVSPHGQSLVARLGRLVGDDLWASRLGQYLENEAFFKTALGPRPSTRVLQSTRITSAQEALRILTKMPEDEWLIREMARAKQALAEATTIQERQAARIRIRDADRGLRVVRVSKTGGSYVDFDMRGRFARRISKAGLPRAVGVFPRNSVAPWVPSRSAVTAARGQAEYAAYRSAVVDDTLGKVRMVGDVSATYLEHRVAIHAVMD